MRMYYRFSIAAAAASATIVALNSGGVAAQDDYITEAPPTFYEDPTQSPQNMDYDQELMRVSAKKKRAFQQAAKRLSNPILC